MPHKKMIALYLEKDLLDFLNRKIGEIGAKKSPYIEHLIRLAMERDKKGVGTHAGK